MTIESVVQTSNPGERIELFRFDATSVGGTVLYFCQGAKESSGITFGGVYYTPADVSFSGFETSATGALPTPKMKLSNSGGVFQALINTYGDMSGCIVQRIRTFKRFLDGEPEADPSAYYGPDMFKIQQKTSENKHVIEWELSAAIDQEGKKLPGRVAIRDTCLWRYRRWDVDAQDFNYEKAQCPYAEAVYFDHNGVSTNAAGDKCGRKITDCKLRFGENGILPFGGFPGMARTRT